MADAPNPTVSLLVNFPLSPRELEWLKEQRRHVRAVFDATYRLPIEARTERAPK